MFVVKLPTHLFEVNTDVIGLLEKPRDSRSDVKPSTPLPKPSDIVSRR